MDRLATLADGSTTDWKSNRVATAKLQKSGRAKSIRWKGETGAFAEAGCSTLTPDRELEDAGKGLGHAEA